MIPDEDLVAFRLKGYNCHIRFVDGEDLFLKVDLPNDQLALNDWLADIEQNINGYREAEPKWGEAVLPLPGIAIKCELIKYVKIF